MGEEVEEAGLWLEGAGPEASLPNQAVHELPMT